MFDKNNRYMTRGVQADISIELQRYMWDCIDKLKEQDQELDYLQVFELSKLSQGLARTPRGNVINLNIIKLILKN